ncbi:MAG: MBL fold metallo-hydrolase [Clostridia bacterium]|nr:MBL fold metallo-hydrolase [Clostridia bacterium]MDD4145588.1 MBL fold metallo-hydrolase [Clostridia bacterium]MDD4665235.1 MBL fold metallo-hydrolase [Clostridia bacterium]
MRFCTLISGSSGNALYVETPQTKVMIDAGKSGKALAQALEEACGQSPRELDALLLSHEHRDHTLGAGVMARRYHLPLYATEGTWCEMDGQIGPIKEEQKHYIKESQTLELGDLKIEFFPVSHDAGEPVGFLLTQGQETLGIATDSGVFTSRMAKALRNVHCLVLEANHDPELLKNGPYPWSLKQRIAGEKGHLSNQGAGLALLQTLGGETRQVILAHLSAENNKPALALQTVKKTLEKNHFNLEEVEITVAPRYRPSRYFK